MKNIYKLFIFIVLISFSNQIYAQKVKNIAFYRKVHVSKVENLYTDPKANRVMLNLGGQIDNNDYGFYGYARTHISRFVLSGLVAINPVDNYYVQEATVVFGFNNSGKATFNQDGKNAVSFKTGGKNKFVSAGRVVVTERYYTDYSGRLTGYNSPDAYYEVYRKVEKDDNVVRKAPARMEINVPTHNYGGATLGAFHWQRNDNRAGNIDVIGTSFGLMFSRNQKSKYRFTYEERLNDVQVIGLGEYKEYPTGNVRKRGTKVSSTNQSIDISMEFLLAPVIEFEKQEMIVKTELGSTTQKIPKKYFGFRFRNEIRQKFISYRFELGMRPGVKYRAGGENGEDNFFTNKVLSGAYLLFGLGFGIGFK